MTATGGREGGVGGARETPKEDLYRCSRTEVLLKREEGLRFRRKYG